MCLCIPFLFSAQKSSIKYEFVDGIFHSMLLCPAKAIHEHQPIYEYAVPCHVERFHWRYVYIPAIKPIGENMMKYGYVFHIEFLYRYRVKQIQLPRPFCI